MSITLQERIQDLIGSAEPGAAMTLKDAYALGEQNITEMTKGFYYTIIYNFQLGYDHDDYGAVTSKHYGEYFDTLASDHGKLKTWRIFRYYALLAFKKSDGSLVAKREAALNAFSEQLLQSLYTNQQFLETGGIFSQNIKDAAGVLLSLVDD
ncbi:hypothetical protein [uncultured Thiocystis sp.]|jgi:hypothetical protein|uniref:hypothetical protein n=1 Tax=uncultured Thiocystis sp. TaxID=1202134 RepID=UPI0025D1305C|nr:hypothetical protein [uncultured Thiocystis sp.]